TGLSHEFRAMTVRVQPGVSAVGTLSIRTQARAASLSETEGVRGAGGSGTIVTPDAAGVAVGCPVGATSAFRASPLFVPDAGGGRSTCTEEMSVWKSKARSPERRVYDEVSSAERWSIRMTSSPLLLFDRVTSLRIRRIADRERRSTRTLFDSKGSSTR